MTVCWRLDTPAQTIVFVSDGSIPYVCYWGQPLPDAEDLVSLAHASQMDITGGMLDANPEISLCPQGCDTFPGATGLKLRDANGALIYPDFKLIKTDETADTLTFVCADADVTLTFTCAAFQDTHVITFKTEIDYPNDMALDWLAAPVLPAPHNSSETLEFSGRWCGEFQLNANPWTQGARLREAVGGRTGHETFPSLIVPNMDTNNVQGGAYGFHYGWSGGHRMISEQLPDGRRQIQFGHASDTQLDRTGHASTGVLYASYSNEGLNGLGSNFQSHTNKHILCFPNPDKPRPVHYNCWEAIYFDHDLETLSEIATKAAMLGAERFVLDDGWFGKRNDDTTSLGDWDIDLDKYPNGLGPLVDHVKSLGMTFGIWFEPEMVNPDSDLYRAHPEWALGPADQTLGRNQMVLDMANGDVRDYLFQKIDAVLSAYDIDYVKWDHNRVLPFTDKHQTTGFYVLLDRLRSVHKDVEFETCSSGGGRIDYGVLQRADRVWLSDSNDAIERFKMQNNAALFLPSKITGSHVGPRHCHTSGRVLPMHFRAWVAASRHMGFEMDPRELDETETRILRDVTTWYKENRDWMHSGIIHRLDCDDPAQLGEMQISKGNDRFVAFLAQLSVSDQILPRPYRLTGLDPLAMYKIHLRNPEDAHLVSRGEVALRDGDTVLSGRALMENGLNLPMAFPATLWVVEGTKIK